MGLTREQALKRFIFVAARQAKWYEGSTAALEIAGCMRPPWPLLRGLLVVGGGDHTTGGILP